MGKEIHLEYFAVFREQTGKQRESISTDAQTAHELYQELRLKYNFSLPMEQLKIAINERFCDWQSAINQNDQIIFLPPVAGG